MKNNKTKLIKIITTSLLCVGGLSVCAAAFLNMQQDRQTKAYSSISSYYSSVSGKGQTLLESLYTKIRQDNNVGYDGLWDSYKRTDIRSDGKIYDLYSDKTMFTPGSKQCGSYSNIGDCYNREHTIPQSWWNSGTSQQGSDLFIVLPSDGKINGYRSNYPYGETTTGTTYKYGSDTEVNRLGTSTSTQYVTGKVFEPFDSRKGDLARTYFYAVTRYWDEGAKAGKVTNWTYGEGDAVFGTGSGYTYGFKTSYLNMLLKWHKQDPVSTWEINRNNNVEDEQGNRNPFIDHPSWVDLIWGGTYGASNTNGESISSNTTVVNGVTTTSGTPSATISLDKTSQSVAVDGTFTIKATTSDNTSVNWTKNNNNISLSTTSSTSGSNITVTGVTAGSTTLTATSTSGASTSCAITITSSGGGTPSGESGTATYVVKSTSSVNTTGTTPTGSSARYSQTYSTAGQMTSGNSTTLSLSGYEGTTITGITLKMKSNSSSGSGNFSAKAGNTTISSISTSAFNSNSWYGSWSNSYVNVTPTISNTSYVIQSGEKLVLTIAATANSLYINSYTITYSSSGSSTTEDSIIIDDSLSISVGSSGEIEALTEGTATSVTWSIQSGSSYISLSNKTNDGCTVTGLAAGTAVVKATFGTASDTCTVTVTEAQPISGDSSDVDLDGGSISNSVITWKTEDGHTTVTQSKGDGTSAPSGTYISAPRVYKGNILSFTADSGYKISSISIVYVDSYKGNSMTAGIALSSDSVINNTTAVSRTWGTTDDGTHVVGSVSSSGLQTIYIQNVASSNNVQLRISSITITYIASSSSATALSWGTSFLSLVTCNNGVTAPNKTKWAETQTNYNALSTTEKNKVLNASANESGTDLEKAVARYVYIVNKYKNRTDYPDYLNKASSANFMNVVNVGNNTTTIIMVIGLVSILSGVSLYFFFYKKKKSI